MDSFLNGGELCRKRPSQIRKLYRSLLTYIMANRPAFVDQIRCTKLKFAILVLISLLLQVKDCSLEGYDVNQIHDLLWFAFRGGNYFILSY